ncbi:hypothetical protein EPA93_24200 [Ktedonosporobacter rubrisoli]|uniref:Ester cyclase n=1 Tax=Ktedonosporobacter rubrisoli TaxID=2509675 RepID=A0A4P6JUA2_KTERU|nr:ester cyclase [Ktedonosporobacter rubrisoli]QBD78915.1 hypothetical protein EPA93_24200 [Ktedonosporobacter rubrisoli]
MEANQALVKRYYEEVLTKRNLQLIDGLFAPDYVYHYSDVPPGLAPGLAGFKQLVSRLLSGYPNLQFSVGEQTVEGDKVISHFTARSNPPIGPVMTIPADPKQVAGSETIKGTSRDRIVNGKIVESWVHFDMPQPLPQVEELPPEEGNK